ncbi:MAG: thymidylate synthase [Mariprofundales bacterium]
MLDNNNLDMLKKLLLIFIICLFYITPIQAGSTGTDKVVAHFMALDADASQSVSAREYLGLVRQKALNNFAHMDRNGDGVVTSSEYRRYWTKEKAKYFIPR